MYPISIRPALNGWIVEVGCQTLTFNSKVTMLTELNKYMDDPEGTEKFYRENAVNRKITLVRAAPADPPPPVGHDTRTYTFTNETSYNSDGTNEAPPMERR